MVIYLKSLKNPKQAFCLTCEPESTPMVYGLWGRLQLCIDAMLEKFSDEILWIWIKISVPLYLTASIVSRWDNTFFIPLFRPTHRKCLKSPLWACWKSKTGTTWLEERVNSLGNVGSQAFKRAQEGFMDKEMFTIRVPSLRGLLISSTSRKQPK